MQLYFLIWALWGQFVEVHTHTKVLLVSFDGFRYDYYDYYKPKNLQKLAKTGVHAPNGIFAAFSTKTFPNHFTIVTGLYEESHGIIDNDMYDPLFNETFELGNNDAKWWDEGGEPIWVTAKLQGKKTAAALWPGSEAEIKGVRPTYYLNYGPEITFDVRVNKAIEWLAKKDVDFVAVYFQDPDRTAHKYGIFSPEMSQAIQSVDNALGKLIDKLASNKLTDKVDLIVMADHGMVNTSNLPTDDSKVIYLNRVINMDDVTIVPQTGPVAGIFPKPGRREAIYQDLIRNGGPHIQVYKKEDIPESWHYKHHRRIMPLLVLADEGYVIARNKEEIGIYTIGQHGYNNTFPTMKPIFFASGPSFKVGTTINSFENVNVYPLMCHLLGIEASPNNGTVDVFKGVLVHPIRSTKGALPVPHRMG